MSADDKTRISPHMANTTVGTQLSGIYELDERIGSGGMGEVYRGHNIQTGDHVAIKIVLPEFARDQTILSLFRKEALILNHLSHDAVVRYHVFTIDPGIGRPYLAMEFVDGDSLFDIVRRGPMPPEDVRKLCHRLASGLSAVHEAGAIHRDLSPDNIILPGGRVDRAKIVDFGIARSATVGGETLIGGRFAGKYNYVSPEQLGLYGGDVSERSDIYSLGLVLAAALRGKPIDMGGSQFEIVEKRRTVPDLSGIDPEFREIVEAMLQPDPQDRPISMAEIAGMTRADTESEGTARPTSFTPRDRPGLPRTEGTMRLGSKAQGHISAAAGEQPFVPHMRPAHLSEPRPAAAARPARATTPDVSRKPAKTRNIAIAALATLAVASGAGIYLSGVMAPPTTTVDTTSLSPSESKPPPADNSASSPDNEPAKTLPPPQPRTESAAPPPKNHVDAAVGQKPEQTAELPSPTKEALQPSAVSPPPEKTQPAGRPDTVASDSQKTAPPLGKITPTEPPAEKALPPVKPETLTSESPKTTSPLGKITPVSPPVGKALTPSPAQPDVVQSRQPERPASQPAGTTSPQPGASPSDIANAMAQQLDSPASARPDEPSIAFNVPKPAIPPASTVDDVAQRVSWVRDFSGGDCFYATMPSATNNALAIEGFGTAVEPFERMLGDFQAKFHVEPDISVRLIEPSQCEVTNFLRLLGRTAADKPQLVLDRTSVPSGSPISGTLVTHGGLVSSVLLIDHKGTAFNLDDDMVATSDKATFSIPISLGNTDKATAKAVPQIIMVITGPRDIQAAAFSTPTPASVLLPKILAEIKANESEFSATAKYFRLGG